MAFLHFHKSLRAPKSLRGPKKTQNLTIKSLFGGNQKNAFHHCHCLVQCFGEELWSLDSCFHGVLVFFVVLELTVVSLFLIVVALCDALVKSLDSWFIVVVSLFVIVGALCNGFGEK